MPSPVGDPRPKVESDSVPRPEYPRPQFVRREWLNLNGEWEFTFDYADEGLRAGWSDGRSLDGRIVVPFPYQCELSGVNDKGIYEIVWYARTFEVPEEWRGRDLLLHFGAADYKATVWVNGQEVGHNRGGHVPFAFDIAPYVRQGANRLAVRVEDRQDPRQPRGKQASSGIPKGIDYYCTTGIWQTVWLEPAPSIRIDELKISPVFDQDALHLHVYLHAPATGWGIEAEVLDGDDVVARADCRTTQATARVLLKIPNAKHWSPGSPHLYGLRVRLLEGGRVIDEIESYAGLRSVSLQDGKVMLNGEPIYLAMVLDQGYWPESYLAAPSDAALREDVEWTRRFGFNGARKHQKIEDPRWLYWCDKLGLMVWAEMPNARAWTPESEEWVMAEWECAVSRDYNHPCIIAWVPVNESMGLPNLKEGHPGQYSFLERIVSATRHQDPNRPIIDNDGWEHTDVTDILAIHDYSHSAEQFRKHYADKLAGGELPATIWTGTRRIFARGSRYHGQPIMLTEVGGILGCPDLPKDKWDRLYSVYASSNSPQELLARYDDVMAGIAGLPFVCGFCYTQLTDIEQEINGLLTYDRKPKVDPEAIAAIHRGMIDSRR